MSIQSEPRSCFYAISIFSPVSGWTGWTVDRQVRVFFGHLGCEFVAFCVLDSDVSQFLFLVLSFSRRLTQWLCISASGLCLSWSRRRPLPHFPSVLTSPNSDLPTSRVPLRFCGYASLPVVFVQRLCLSLDFSAALPSSCPVVGHLP